MEEDEGKPLLSGENTSVNYSNNTETGTHETVSLCSCFISHKKSTIALIVVVLVLLMISVVLLCLFLFVIIPTVPEPLPPDERQLTVLSLSVWGSPGSFGTKDKDERIRAIGEFIKNQTKYDIFLLQELWMRPDHATLNSFLPSGFTMTEVGMLAPALCDGRVAPTFCSGLAVISRFPFKETEFTVYSVHGSFMKQFTDGEYWARKGVGRVSIEPAPNLTVDIFLSSTAAWDYNRYYRQIQASEFSKTVDQSNADFILAAGDFNSDPRSGESTYKSLTSGLQDTGRQFLGNSWLDPRYATSGNKENSYSQGDTSLRYDYFLQRTSGDNNVINVKNYRIPILKTDSGKSFSNHEAVEASYSLSKN